MIGTMDERMKSWRLDVQVQEVLVQQEEEEELMSWLW